MTPNFRGQWTLQSVQEINLKAHEMLMNNKFCWRGNIKHTDSSNIPDSYNHNLLKL